MSDCIKHSSLECQGSKFTITVLSTQMFIVIIRKQSEKIPKPFWIQMIAKLTFTIALSVSSPNLKDILKT